MSIITGGTTTKQSTNSTSGHNQTGNSNSNTPQIINKQYKQNMDMNQKFNQNNPMTGMTSTMSGGNPPQPMNNEQINNLKDMIEVKTSSNYKLGKQTINSRIGEDYEPDKPIMNFNQ